MASKLLGIDPGKATGLVLIDTSDPENPIPMYSGELDVSQFYGKMESYFTEFGEQLHVVIEDFKITPQTGKLSDAPWSLNLIGVTQYFCWRYAVGLTVQKPAEKPFASNPRLHAVGFWHKGGGGHANDAFRHAMIYLANQNPQWVRKLIVSK